MARNLLTATFDAATELKDGGAVTAAGAAQVGGTNRVVNLGNAFTTGVIVVDVDTVDVTTGDEGYTIAIQGSSVSNFGSDVHNIARIQVGAAAVTGNSANTGTGRYTAPFINSADGATALPYIRAYITPVGTTPSINCRVWLTKSPLD